MSRLLDAAGDAPFVFVAGKGGVGKTTVAGALALEFADSGTPVHLISTDPAHSLADLLQHPVGGDAVESPCSSLLRVEEFDASRAAGEWLDSALGPVSGIVESGTYLDGDDVAAFSHLALPGIDEMMAVLRLVELLELADGTRVVVDTAPTGHTLRLLDAADTHEGIADALRAMADKAAAVAGAMTGRAVRMKGEDIIDRLDRTVTAYRGQVLAPAAFVVARRAGDLVEAETRRLVAELDRRGLRVAALLTTGPAGSEEPEAGAPGQEGHTGSGRVPHPVLLEVPLLAGVAGCDGLRMWRRHVTAVRGSTPGPGPAPPPGPGPAPPPDGTPSAISPPVWLAGAAGRLLLFAGKGGVGKSTCAAAAAVALAETRDVLLCSTDPAGSLGDLLVDPGERLPDRLRVLQIEPAAQLERLRDAYQEEVVAALEHLGLTQSAALDRRVIGTLWNLSPPGLDELAATAAMLGAAGEDELVVIDSAPTGHFLRLLEMPEVALGWTRQLMRVFVKYGISGVAGGAAESLLELSRELRGLRDTLHDSARTGVIIVTLDEPMVRAETGRLEATLAGAGIRVAAVLLNRDAGTGSAPPPARGDRPGRSLAGASASRGAGAYRAGAPAAIRAPALDPPPAGAAALRGFVDTWNIVE